jgi:hypothetical protein
LGHHREGFLFYISEHFHLCKKYPHALKWPWGNQWHSSTTALTHLQKGQFALWTIYFVLKLCAYPDQVNELCILHR